VRRSRAFSLLCLGCPATPQPPVRTLELDLADAEVRLDSKAIRLMYTRRMVRVPDPLAERHIAGIPLRRRQHMMTVPIPDSPFPSPDSGFPVPQSGLPIPAFRDTRPPARASAARLRSCEHCESPGGSRDRRLHQVRGMATPWRYFCPGREGQNLRDDTMAAASGDGLGVQSASARAARPFHDKTRRYSLIGLKDR
jgi:hypothetical protein